MRTRSLIFFLLISLAALFTGCPGMNIPGISNSITIIHDGEGTITSFGVSRVVCGDAKPTPANVLPETLMNGSEYTVSGLPDGEYIILYKGRNISGLYNTELRQFVAGGVNFKVYYRNS